MENDSFSFELWGHALLNNLFEDDYAIALALSGFSIVASGPLELLIR